MPDVDYNLRGDEGDLTRSLDDAIDVIRQTIAELEGLDGQLDSLRTKGPESGTKLSAGFTLAATGATALAGGIVAVATAFVDYQNELAQTVTEMELLETRTGLSMRTLDALRGAARSVGLELDEMVPEDLAVRIREAAEGSGAGSDAFKALNIEALDLNGNLRDADDVFRELVDKLSDMEDKTRAASIADDLFSDAGTRLLSVLDDGSESLDAFNERAEFFGTDIGPDAAAAADDWREAMGLLNDVTTGFKNDLVELVQGPGTAFVNMLSTTLFFLRTLASGATWDELDAQMTEFFEKAREQSEETTDQFEEDQESQQEFNQRTADKQKEIDRTQTIITLEELQKISVAMDKERQRREEKDDAAAARRQAKADREAERDIERIEELGEKANETIEKKFAEALEERQKAIGDFTIDMIGRIADIADGFQGLLTERLSALDEEREAVDEQLAEIEEKRRSADSTELQRQQNQLNARKAVLNAEQEEVRRGIRAAHFAKQAEALSAIAVNTAVAITNALAQLGPIAGAFAAGAITATAGVQAGLVLAQDPPAHDGRVGLGSDEVRLGGTVVRQGEQFAVVNQRGAETVDALNRDRANSTIN